jgi:hypothetical protein
MHKATTQYNSAERVDRHIHCTLLLLLSSAAGGDCWEVLLPAHLVLCAQQLPQPSVYRLCPAGCCVCSLLLPQAFQLQEVRLVICGH